MVKIDSGKQMHIMEDINEFVKLSFFKKCMLNIQIILIGLYLILMVLGQFILLKILILVIGLLLIIDGAFGLVEDIREFRKYRWFNILLFKSVFTLIEIIFGIILILIGVASLK